MTPLILPLWLAVAPMPPVTLAEESALAGGAPIVRVLAADGAIRSGVIDINAPPDEVFQSVLDLRGRAQEGTEIEVTSRTPALMTATLKVGFMSYEATLYVRYDIDPTARVCHFYLDPTQTSDIDRLEGDFMVVPRGAGSRLYYHGVSDFPDFFPDRIRRWFAAEGVEDVLIKIRALSEA